MGPHWVDLEAPFRRALELAWASFRAGSLGIGAVITDAGGAIVVEGRNRLFEHPTEDAPLAGSTLAHAEIDALSKVRWRQAVEGHALWTSLEPCLQCAHFVQHAIEDASFFAQVVLTYRLRAAITEQALERNQHKSGTGDPIAGPVVCS